MKNSNLRKATIGENSCNRKSKHNGTSKYLGVTKFTTKYNTYWRVSCKKNKKEYRALCKTEIEAALKYNKFAKLNVIS